MNGLTQYSNSSQIPGNSILNFATIVPKDLSNTSWLCFGMRKVTFALCLFLLMSCELTQARNELAKRMAAEEGQGSKWKRISELKSNIRMVEREVEKTIELVRNKGTYWRLLGLKYMDYKMWKEAASAFEEAIDIYPESAFLLYNRALSLGQLSRLADTQEQKMAYLLRAREGYKQAISIEPRFTPAMYALAVLLVFEFEEPLEAQILLEDYLEIERGDINARFLLARTHVELNNNVDALRLYEEISNIARNEDDIRKADELYRIVESGVYEQ